MFAYGKASRSKVFKKNLSDDYVKVLSRFDNSTKQRIQFVNFVTNTTERSTQICSLVFDLLFSWLQLYACIIFAY